MFRNVLVPTDGTALSESAIRHAVGLAKEVGAKVILFYARPEFGASLYGDEALLQSMDPDLLSQAVERQVSEVLGKAQAIAEAAGIPYELYSLHSGEPYEAIIAAAQEKGCDVIVMASHGRSGVKSLLIGSQTQKVLTHSKIPVLVYR